MVVALAGGILGLGVDLTLLAICGRSVVGTRRWDLWTSRASRSRWSRSLAAGVAGALVIAWITAWALVAVVSGGLIGWIVSGRVGRQVHTHEIDTVDAIATWTEQLRDTMSAAHGLQQAVVATAVLAPSAISHSVSRLAARMEFQQFEEGLREFALEIDHPVADFVVAALVTAHRYQARDVASLLGHLADCARDEAAMRRRIWVGRARARSAVRIIALVVVFFVVSLLVFDREYLSPYRSATGQFILTGVIALFTASFMSMERMGRIAVPDRFVIHQEVMPA